MSGRQQQQDDDFDIDAAAAAFDANRSQRGKQQPSVLQDGPPDGDDENGDPPDGDRQRRKGPDGDAPPGFLSYEEYIEQGGDPDMYRGRKAYEAEHGRISENKQLRRELKEMKQSVQRTMEAVQEWQVGESDRLRATIEAELAQARDADDVDGAIAAQRKLDEHDRKKQQQQVQPRKEHPVIADFRVNNPRIDHDAEDFDEEFNADVEAYFNSQAQQLTQNWTKAMTEGQMKRVLKLAMEQAERLHGRAAAAADDDDDDDDDPAPRQRADERESARNNRRGGGGSRRRAAPREPKPDTTKYVIDNPRNPRQRNAASEVEKMIREKYGDAEGDKFAANLMRKS